jgi:hypothetical protein
MNTTPKKPDLEKAKMKYKRGLVSLEILELPVLPKNVEEAEKMYDERVQHKTYVIDDLSRPYIIRLAYTEDKASLKNVDPEYLDEGDRYEISESIQEILRENDFPVIKSAFPDADTPEQAPVHKEPKKPKPKLRKVIKNTKPMQLVRPKKDK